MTLPTSRSAALPMGGHGKTRDALGTSVLIVGLSVGPVVFTFVGVNVGALVGAKVVRCSNLTSSIRRALVFGKKYPSSIVIRSQEPM